MSTQMPASTDPQSNIKFTVVPTYDQHIAVALGTRRGKPRIVGRRITVADIALWHLRQARPVAEIAQEYDLSYAQIYAALTYYYDHKAEIDQREAEDLAAVEALKQRHPSKLQTKLEQSD